MKRSSGDPSSALFWSGLAAGLFIAPALIGNILGGVSLVAARNHAQVVSGGGGDAL